jgi:transglutaminase superfamily protein
MWMTSMDKVWQLPAKDRKLLIRSLLLLPAIHAALLMLGYTRLHTALQRMVPLGKGKASFSELEIMDVAQRIVQIVCIAAGHGIYKATCLRKSLLTWWFLREEGIEGQICFGVRLVGQNLEAHAWVEYQGMVLNDPQNTRLQFPPLSGTLPATETGL